MQSFAARILHLLLAMSLVSPALAQEASSATAQQPSVPNTQLTEANYPCAIVMCFSNPKGPRAVSQCNPPINWLETGFLNKGKPPPACSFGDANGTTANYGPTQNLVCPTAFTAEQVNGNLTGVCLRPLTTCQNYTPSTPGAACFTYTLTDDGGNQTSYYDEYVIPTAGVTNYAMTISNNAGYSQNYYFNIDGTNSSPLSESIIYRTTGASNVDSAGGGN